MKTYQTGLIFNNFLCLRCFFLKNFFLLDKKFSIIKTIVATPSPINPRLKIPLKCSNWSFWGPICWSCQFKYFLSANLLIQYCRSPAVASSSSVSSIASFRKKFFWKYMTMLTIIRFSLQVFKVKFLCVFWLRNMISVAVVRKEALTPSSSGWLKIKSLSFRTIFRLKI